MIARQIIPILAIAAVAGCGGRPSKRELVAAINESIRGESCFALRDMAAVRWPLRVERRFEIVGESKPHPIIAAMQTAGYVTVQQEQGRYGSTIDVITPNDDARKWWNESTGYCVGKKVVADVQQWTEPGESSPMPVEVSYTWQLTDVPSWAKRPEFDSVEGMKTPVSASTMVQKTNNGWKVL